MDRELRREIILDNYEHPFHKHDSDDTYFKTRTNNESCIDDLNIYFIIFIITNFTIFFLIQFLNSN